MISDFEQLEILFREIDQQLTSDVPVYIIGGVVLLVQGFKPATKDIDIILPNKETYAAFVNALKSVDFKKREPTEIYKKMEIDVILERDDFRIDIFLQAVCKKLTLSKGMKNRATNILKLKYLNLFLCSNEDILIFKSITEREGYLEDCITLAKRGINWDVILKEIQSQIHQSGEDVWITWFGERLDILEDKGIIIPIMDEVNKLRDNYFEKLEKKFADKT